MRASFAAFAAAAATTALAAAASANGRYPEANQLVVDPGDPSHLVVRATYGTLHSHDAGKSFGWVCEAMMGYGGVLDPAIGVLKGGSVIAGIFTGLATDDGGGCNWDLAKGDLAGQYVTDVVVRPDDAAHAFALVSSGADGGFLTFVAETTDGGKTWTRIGAELGADFVGQTIEVARSDPERLYVGGSAGSGTRAAVVAHSTDRGATWTRTTLAIAGAESAWVSAVDPANADRVYVRTPLPPADDGGVQGDHLAVSDDGAATFRDAYAAQGTLLGFALSPDGKTVAIGGQKDKLLTAPADTLQFQTKSAAVSPQCLTWTEAKLYVCALEATDGYTIGTSTDDATFTPLAHLVDACPLDCPGGAVQTTCGGEWSALQQTFGQDPNACSAADAGADAGAKDGGAGAGGGTPDEPGGASSSSGGCSTERPGAPAWGLVAIACAIGSIAAGRPRRRERS